MYLTLHLTVFKAIPVDFDEYTPLMNIWNSQHPGIDIPTIQDLGLIDTNLKGQDKTNPYIMILNLITQWTGVGLMPLRWFSIFFGLLILGVVYRVGSVLFSPVAGFMSAFYLIFQLPFIEGSGIARPETLYYFFWNCALLLIFLNHKKPTPKTHFFVGLSIGLAMFIHFRAWPGFIGVLTAYWFLYRKDLFKLKGFSWVLIIGLSLVIIQLWLQGERLAFYAPGSGYLPPVTLPLIQKLNVMYENLLWVFDSNIRSLNWVNTPGYWRFWNLNAIILVMASFAVAFIHKHDRKISAFLAVLLSQLGAGLLLLGLPNQAVHLLPWACLSVGGVFYLIFENTPFRVHNAHSLLAYTSALLVLFLYDPARNISESLLLPIILIGVFNFLSPSRRPIVLLPFLFLIAVFITHSHLPTAISFWFLGGMTLQGILFVLATVMFLIISYQWMGSAHKHKPKLALSVTLLLFLFFAGQWTTLVFNNGFFGSKGTMNIEEKDMFSIKSKIKPGKKVMGEEACWWDVRFNDFFGLNSHVDPIFTGHIDLHMVNQTGKTFRPDYFVISKGWSRSRLKQKKLSEEWFHQNWNANAIYEGLIDCNNSPHSLYSLTWPNVKN